MKYIYIERERERDRDRETETRVCERKRIQMWEGLKCVKETGYR